MPKWPHEYLVRERAGDEDGLTYWTMGAPVEETIIINRCKKEDSYEVSEQKGRLP